MTRSIPCGIVAAILAGASTLTVQSLNAAGYAIAEQSISGLGQGFAGAAALAEDASTIWHNPAGMSFLGNSPQLTGGLHFIMPTAEFNNTGSYTIGASPLGYLNVPLQGPDGTSDSPAIVPNLSYAHPVSDSLSLGFGINAPFGLRTSYEEGWVGRYLALETDLQTINFNPSISYKINDWISIGGGVSYVTAEAVLSSAVDFGLGVMNYILAGVSEADLSSVIPTLSAGQQDIIANRGYAKYDGKLRLSGDDEGFGANFGFILQPVDSVRIGVHYRSQVELELAGTADFTVPAAFESLLGARYADQGGRVDLTLPASLSISAVHEVTENITVLADVTWTDWSVFDALIIRYDGGLSDSPSVIPEKWQDTWRYSLGARWRLNDQITLRTGFVMDEAAVKSPQYRSPRIPDADRTWLTGGLHLDLGEGFAMDVSYAHILVSDAVTENYEHTAGQVLVGENTAQVDIISIGGVYRF